MSSDELEFAMARYYLLWANSLAYAVSDYSQTCLQKTLRRLPNRPYLTPNDGSPSQLCCVRTES